MDDSSLFLYEHKYKNTFTQTYWTIDYVSQKHNCSGEHFKKILYIFFSLSRFFLCKLCKKEKNKHLVLDIILTCAVAGPIAIDYVSQKH